ncbi:hypothetical protein T05_8214 [Trichinella murrelli]|uniref:Uncharacterized protein n=1 Tax=Trichinella murrelli TaxID=144512 RepID=A0A0V0T5P8_9BILA|nr:hypothetical protein T05_8214 [Trichinella murrelli]
MIWHSNCWDKRSRTVVVPHTQDVYFGFFPITSELPDVEVLHCACVSGGFAVIEVDRKVLLLMLVAGFNFCAWSVAAVNADNNNGLA